MAVTIQLTFLPATGVFFHGTGREFVSIHAPAGGATSPARASASVYPVSIHAPAGGRLVGEVPNGRCSACFNPRPRGGGDTGVTSIEPHRIPFQSTPPRGGRPMAYLERDADADVSIHAPAGGATPGGRHGAHQPAVSIHAPAGGATGRRGRASDPAGVSIHAPAGGATIDRRRDAHAACRFNPRPRGGGDGPHSKRFSKNGKSRRWREPRRQAPRNSWPAGRTCANRLIERRKARARNSPTWHGRLRFAPALRPPAVPPDRDLAWRPHARPAGASWRRDSRSGGCRSRGRSPCIAGA